MLVNLIVTHVPTLHSLATVLTTDAGFLEVRAEIIHVTRSDMATSKLAQTNSIHLATNRSLWRCRSALVRVGRAERDGETERVAHSFKRALER